MAKLYLVCGPSGAGKTTYSKLLSQKLGILRVCPDEIYALYNGTDLDRSNKYEVWNTMFSIINVAQRNNKDVIVDTTALSVYNRDELCEWFPEFEKHMIVIETPRDLRRSNNRNRKRVIPEQAMDKMDERWVRPTKEEKKWKTIKFLTNENNSYFLLKEEINN